MKTVMKKIFSLMLVAVLLVSAVPFAASADEVTKVFDLTLEPGTYQVDAIVAENYTGSSTNYWVHRTAPSAEDYVRGASFEAVEGGTYTLYVVETVAAPTTEPTTEATTAPTEAPKPTTYTVRFSVDGNDSFWYLDVVAGKTVKEPGIEYGTDYTYLNKVGDVDNRVFMGWSTKKDATAGDSLNTVVHRVVNENITYYAIYKNVAVAPPTSSNQNGITNKDNTNKIYLHVYLNGNASTIALTRDITNYYLLDDDKISNGEVWTFLKDYYYTAKDPNVGLQIDGLYVNTGSSGTFPQNYYTDTKQDTLSDIKSLLDNGYVHVNVMLKNAVSYASLESSSKADSSNPKTGDNIFAPVAVMSLSVSALAVLFYLNKKRAY